MTKIICCIFTIDTKIGTIVSKGEILKVANLGGYIRNPKEVIVIITVPFLRKLKTFCHSKNL